MICKYLDGVYTKTGYRLRDTSWSIIFIQLGMVACQQQVIPNNNIEA
ncbi:MAG: hypothetical protein JWP34_4488 [Massilia sp.]|jgi:hypothetical protein|nr:hypothetical protein [Massilia sp.]